MQSDNDSPGAGEWRQNQRMKSKFAAEGFGSFSCWPNMEFALFARFSPTTTAERSAFLFWISSAAIRLPLDIDVATNTTHETALNTVMVFLVFIGMLASAALESNSMHG